MNIDFSKKLSILVSKKGNDSLETLIKKTSELSKNTNLSELSASIYLANELKKIGDYVNAKKLYEKLLQQTTNDADKSTLFNNYGALLQDLGDNQKAIELYEHSLHISRNALGPEHPSVATTMNNLAAVYETLGHYQKALELYEHSLHISRNALGPEHPSVATTMNNLAAVYEALGH
ncbi:MAG: tetratricopeptide repeat protein, partial [Desulfobacteraceae bacterium]